MIKLSSSMTFLFTLLLSLDVFAETKGVLDVDKAKNSEAGDYKGSSFNQIKEAVFRDAYESLPQYRVSRKHFGKKGSSKDNHVFHAGRRTLTVRDDLWEFPNKQKLFQANGICFVGEWIIDKKTPFTGQFSDLTRTPVIARASVALSGTKQKNKRAFGFALKLFPASTKETVVPTLNTFVMHSLSGTVRKHVLDLTMDNEPPLNGLPPISQLGVAYRLLSDFSRADKVVSQTKPDVGFRPVAHLAEMTNDGERVKDDKVIAPRWLRLRPSVDLVRVDKDDFREELRVENYPENKLSWIIEVAAGHADVDGNEKQKAIKKSKAQWLVVGQLILNESIISPGCDQRLHFSHPVLQ